jgi:glycosyltransferase involved in cell wall biosynthesis
VTGRPTVIVVTEKQLFPIDEGNRARIVTMVQALRSFGFRVVLVARRPIGSRAALRTRWFVDKFISVDTDRFSAGSPLAYDCAAFFDPLRAAVRRFAPVAVIVEYIWMAPCLDVVESGILRVVDTLDLMHVRRRFRDVLSHIWVDCSDEEERLLLEKADAILAIQAREMERFRTLVPSRRVIYLPHCVPIQPTPPARAQQVVAIVASDNPGNVEGFNAFVTQGWPRVRRRHPQAELRIFGPLASKAAAGEGIVRIGYSRDLTRAYGEATVLINPVRFGTGLKIKTVEALGRGKAVVTTSCGAEGLDSGAGSAFVVADDMEQFADEICMLFENEQRRRQFESAASVFAAAEFSRDKAYRAFLELLGSRVTTDQRVRLVEESGG